MPSENPFPAANDLSQPAPYVASNDYSVFTAFDSGTGMVRSWIFDGTDPDSEPVLLDEFSLADTADGPSDDEEPTGSSVLLPGSSLSSR